MPKMTLLEIVQDILSDMNDDEVNSINDTVQSLQVAQIVKSTYFNIIDGRDWPHLYSLFQLEGQSNVNKPTHMNIPSGVLSIAWIKYDAIKDGETRSRYKKIKYKTPEEFLELLDTRNSDASNVQSVVDDSGVTLLILDDIAPTYYTSFDNETIIFDSFDALVDNTLHDSKTQCYGKKDATFTLEDSFIPDLPPQTFSYLLNEAKSTSFLRLKEIADQKSEQHSITQRRRQSQDAWAIAGGITYPNYGRK